jgi:hypothetical protein
MISLENRGYKAVLAITILVLLAGVFQMERILNRQREQLGLTRMPPLENAPPVLAFTTGALGGFRGLISNVLWVRMSDLQEQDKFFEMMQLADWITKLEPRFTQVWLNQAWNMSYNVSVKFKDPLDRWRWVKAAIELLRDEGLKYNPDDPMIYRELSWQFQHKMGMNMDDAHLVYKNEWAQEMAPLFEGGGRPNYDELLNPKTPDAQARAKRLREVYKMDPAIMKEVDERYGPLEWRLPEASAIYWAHLATIKSRPGQDLLPVRRVIYQSLQLAFVRGGFERDRFTGRLTLGPNLNVLKSANAAYEEMMRIDPDPENKSHIANAHKNFLKVAPYYLYVRSRHAEAQYWLNLLKERYPDSVPKNMSLEEYALKNVEEEVKDTNVDKTTSLIQGLIADSLLDLAWDEDENAVNKERLARRIWERYQEAVGGQKHRIGLAPYETLKSQVLERLLSQDEDLSPEVDARLRTKLRIPFPTANTNSVPQNVTSSAASTNSMRLTPVIRSTTSTNSAGK